MYNTNNGLCMCGCGEPAPPTRQSDTKRGIIKGEPYQYINGHHPIGKHNNWGETNPSYKGEDAGYEALHIYVKRRLPKPPLCEICGLVPPIDLANKSNEYHRDLSDWYYLCRKCHMISDGRTERMKEFNAARKHPNQICLNCGIEYGPKYGKMNKYCGRNCYMEFKIKTNLEKKNNETRYDLSPLGFTPQP